MSEGPQQQDNGGRGAGTAQTDITLFGATGFVGKIVANYLAEHAPKNAKIALAGRNREKLMFLKNQLLNVHQGVLDWKIVEADAFDRESLDELVAATKVVISTVGPFARYGENLVAACAEAGTHYVDSSGEVLFMRRMIDSYGDVAKKSGARIIHACGFDSVPSDLGMFLTAHAAQKDGHTLAEVTNLVSMRGAMSGGTVDSIREQFSQVQRNPHLGQILKDPYSLSPDRSDEPDLGDQPDFGFLATEEVGAPEGWAGPFLMAGANSRVVRRSNSLQDHAYGKDLRYREFQTTGPGLKGRARALSLAAMSSFMVQALKTPALRDFLSRWVPEPGEGPTTTVQENGYFRCVFHGFVKPNPAPKTNPDYIATVFSQGDPGYKSTSKMLSVAAMCLALYADELPESEGSVLTPATGLGMAYVQRLRMAGMRLDVSRG